MRAREKQERSKPSVMAGVSMDTDVAGCQITLSWKMKSLGVTFDPVLSMKQHIISTCKAHYYQVHKT